MNDEETSIINFNYTNPFNRNNRMINVHGDIASNNIIFGIDDSILKENNEDIYIFSKTYRKLFINNFYKDIFFEEALNGPERIVFYGHSLNEGDYSYFQSIFDAFNIYDKYEHYYKKTNESYGTDFIKVKLIFFFSYYDKYDEGIISEKTKNEIRKAFTDCVYKLIHTYGKSFDNKQKGKNLIHKLILENRLQIKELEESLNL